MTTSHAPAEPPAAAPCYRVTGHLIQVRTTTGTIHMWQDAILPPNVAPEHIDHLLATDLIVAVDR